MARTSGRTTNLTLPNSLLENKGFTYKISKSNQSYLLTTNQNTYPLTYFIGSGTEAQSFLLSIDNFLYESPITWYAKTTRWDLAPGYQSYTYPYLTRAIAPACLDCHATAVQPIAGSQNGYANPPFLESGISCERCHGPGAKHATTARREDIINPARLAPDRRDSICNQCHLSGDIRIERANKHQHDFTPGDRLYDYSVPFVRTANAPRMKVTSHAENLAQSTCSKAAGDRLWCGTCHDAHNVPAPEAKSAWFNSRCLTCHTPTSCKARQTTNCIACHMPKSTVTDAEHVVYTDHSIPRRPQPTTAPAPTAPLIAFGIEDTNPRDLGLAYAIIALRDNSTPYREQALTLLREAESQNPDDPQTLAYLAGIYKSKSDDTNAARLYQRLLTIDPTQSAAHAALGAYAMEQNHPEQAIDHWKKALKISPALVLVRYNLAIALIKTGHPGEAREALTKTLEFNPAFTAAKNLLTGLNKAGRRNSP